ncbi:MAG: type II toxin-antitoxin system YafQ family toxin [Elusimicrobia bacterium]|nr:type II toxin-antitoxin system YafQ family toxin [Elusimicrobiota bacterium]
MRNLRVTSRFDRDLKLAIKRGKGIEKFKIVRDQIIHGELLGPKYRDHSLKGEWCDCRECHIDPDWLLIYKIERGALETVVLIRMGSHSDLFE